jgi:hypothetical protein
MINVEPKVPASLVSHSNKQNSERIENVGFTLPSHVTSRERAEVPHRGYGFQTNFS